MSDIEQLGSDPSASQLTRKHQQFLAQIVNSLIRRGDLYRDPSSAYEWRIRESIGPVSKPVPVLGDFTEGMDETTIMRPGPQGLQGPIGLQGIPGRDGIDPEDLINIPGPIGLTGATGPQGPIGLSGEDAEDWDLLRPPGATLASDVINTPSICDFRLTLTTGTPLPIVDQSGQSTIYLTPYVGKSIALYDSTAAVWRRLSTAEISVAVPSTQWRAFDIYCYNNGGTATLETTNWNQLSGTITNATNASPIVVTSTGHGLNTGDYIFASGVGGNTGLNNGAWWVTKVDANSFSCNFSVGTGAFSSNGSWWQLNGARATAIAQQDGVWVKSGDSTRRYMGSGCTNATSGQMDDKQSDRMLYNFYNGLHRSINVAQGGSHTYATNFTRYINADPTKHIKFMAGFNEELLFAVSGQLTGDDTNQSLVAITFDGTNLGQIENTNLKLVRASSVSLNRYAAGVQIIPLLENSPGAATITVGAANLRGLVVM